MCSCRRTNLEDSPGPEVQEKMSKVGLDPKYLQPSETDKQSARGQCYTHLYYLKTNRVYLELKYISLSRLYIEIEVEKLAKTVFGYNV